MGVCVFRRVRGGRGNGRVLTETEGASVQTVEQECRYGLKTCGVGKGADLANPIIEFTKYE